MRIGVVDDDESTIAFITQVLANSGYSCVPFQRSVDVLPALRDDTFDLLLLDWNMSRMTGLDIINWARENVDPCPPIIMITSRSNKEDIAAALTAGADDYIVKPEAAVVIAARVEAVLRRSKANQVDQSKILCGPYTFDNRQERATLHEEDIALTSKEFALAYLFFSNPNRPLSRRYIMDRVWKSMGDVTTRTLDMHVSRIRSKLHLCTDNGYRLKTEFGFGYRLEEC